MIEFINEIGSYKLRGMPCPHCGNKADLAFGTDDEDRLWVEELEKFNPKKYANRNAKKGI